MKKAAFIGNSFKDSDFDRGGGQKFYFELLKKLSEKGFLIDIYCKSCEIKESLKINKIFVIKEQLDYKNPKTVENFYNQVEILLSKEKYDYVFSEGFTPAVDINFIQYHSTEYILKLKKPLFQFFERKIKQKRIDYERNCFKKNFRKIFAVSGIVKEDICTNYDISEEKVAVLRPGVTLPENPAEKTSNEIFTFGISATGIVRKGGYIFLKALNLLKKRDYNFKAKIIYPHHKTNLRLIFLVALYGLDENIEFLGFQKNMENFYSSIDCLVMPSVHEAFGLVALEAMIRKKTVIVSSAAGASELILDGVEGHIVSFSKKPEYKLAEKMEYVLKNHDKLNFWEENAYKKAKEFTWERTFKQLLKELERL